MVVPTATSGPLNPTAELRILQNEKRRRAEAQRRDAIGTPEYQTSME